RQALFNATDRQGATDVVTGGASPPADNWFPPSDAFYPLVKDAIPPYPYDLTVAQQRMEQAGWVRGTDGTLVSRASGEPFAVELWGAPNNGSDRVLPTIASGWQAIGAQV